MRLFRFIRQSCEHDVPSGAVEWRTFNASAARLEQRVPFTPSELEARVTEMLDWFRKQGTSDPEIAAMRAKFQLGGSAVLDVRPAVDSIAFPERCADCRTLARERITKLRVRLAEWRAHAERNAKRSGDLAAISSMEPHAFERLVWLTYERLGWVVTPGRGTRDGGVDGVLVKGEVRLLLQCKRQHKSVGSPIVQQLYGCIDHHSASGCVVVTTAKITKAAREFARAQKRTVHLIDGAALIVLLGQATLTPDDFLTKGIRIPDPLGGVDIDSALAEIFSDLGPQPDDQ